MALNQNFRQSVLLEEWDTDTSLYRRYDSKGGVFERRFTDVESALYAPPTADPDTAALKAVAESSGSFGMTNGARDDAIRVIAKALLEGK